MAPRSKASRTPSNGPYGFAILIGLAIVTLAAVSRADSTNPIPRDQTEAVREAERAERQLDPARAAACYRQARDADPATRLGRRAAIRLDWLEARREGDFRPLRELFALRALPAEARRAERVAEFERQIADFPPGRLRREARALVADCYAQLNDPAAAARAYESWLAEPGLDGGERQLAATGAALSRRALGDESGALALLEREALGDRPEAALLKLSRLHRSAQPLAWAALCAFAAAGLWWGGWRGFAPRGLARALSARRLLFGAYTLLCPVLLALFYSYDVLRVVGPLAGSSALVALAASIFGVGLGAAGASRARRSVLSMLGLLAQLALGYLLLYAAGALLGFFTAPKPL
jgi:hypothetical protein